MEDRLDLTSPTPELEAAVAEEVDSAEEEAVAEVDHPEEEEVDPEEVASAAEEASEAEEASVEEEAAEDSTNHQVCRQTGEALLVSKVNVRCSEHRRSE